MKRERGIKREKETEAADALAAETPQLRRRIVAVLLPVAAHSPRGTSTKD